METKPVSISTSANLHIVNDPYSINVDLVSLSFELFVRLFPNTQKDVPIEGDKFVLIKLIGVPDYFSKFKIYKVSSIDDLPLTPSSVTFTNHTNLARFGRNLTVSGCVIQSISENMIPKLTEVIVDVPSSIYDVLHNSPKDAVKEAFITRYNTGNGGVLTQGDMIRLINGHVALCEPFYQGTIDLSTNLVFVKGPEENEEEVQEDNDADELDISRYLYDSVLVDDDEEQESETHFLDVASLPHPMSVDTLGPATEDSELYAFMSTDDLSKLGFPIFNGDLAVLVCNNIETIVKVFTLLEPNKSFEKNTVHLSPLLLVNFNITEYSKASFKPYIAPSQSLAEAIPIAKTATVARVVSPITMDKTYQQSFLAGLKSTFHLTSKCLRQDDVFPVCIDSLLAKALFEISLQNNSSNEDEQNNEIVPTGNPDSVAWFKIVEISGSESTDPLQRFRIDPTQTALTSSGVEFVRTPKNEFSNWSDYLKLPPNFNYAKYCKGDSDLFKFAQEFYRVIVTGMRTNSHIDLVTTILLNSMSRGLGKAALVKSIALELGLNLIELDAFELIRPGAEQKTIGLLAGKIEKQLNGQLDATNVSNYNILFIKHLENLCVQVDQNEQGANSSNSLSIKVVDTLMDFVKKYKNTALVASCNDIDKLSDTFRQTVKFQIDVTVPSEQERLEIFKFLLEKETQPSNTDAIPQAYEDRIEFAERPLLSRVRIDVREDVNPQTLALQSAGLTPRDLISIIKKVKYLGLTRLQKWSTELNIPIMQLIKVGNGGCAQLIPEDFDKAINEARNEFSDSIGAPRIPNVKWEDIGGLDLVKDEILDTIDMPLKHPELFSNGLKKRSGILFYGPPGTGKTLLAKAIATNFSLNFFSVKGPELLNMYIGESEANVRRVFQKARDAKPCVIFFDELDSVAPKRGNQGDSGGVMDRIVSQLLAELDGMSGGESNGEGVFVVGATNRPDLLDEALLRPGRFDKMLYLGISDTDEKQRKILEALTRKFKLGDDVDLAEIAADCTFNFTGADFYALCSDSMLNAMTRAAGEVDAKLRKFNEERKAEGKEEVSSRWWFDKIATPDDLNVLVTMQDFRKAQRELSPSVSAEELAHYLRVKENFEGGKKKTQEQNGGEHVENGHPEGNGHSESNGYSDTNGHSESNGHTEINGNGLHEGAEIIISED